MTNILRLSLQAMFLVLIPLMANAQNDESQRFLSEIGIIDSVYSETLKEQREIYIQFPAYFNPESNIKYPVVYVLDGDVLLPTVANVLGYYSGGFTPDMIIVGISNGNNRTRDLTTSKIEERRGMPFNQEHGEADNFRKFIEAELIPFIEDKYPVSSFRTLIGHSYGGLFAIHMLINHAELFSNYIAIDPSLDWDNQKLLKEAGEKLASQDYKGKSLFMSLGGQLHMQEPTVTIENVMEDTSEFTLFSRSNITFSNMVKKNSENGLAHEWKFYPRDLHGTIPFPSIMDGLISTFNWYQMEKTDKFNSPSTPKEELFEIVNYRAKKLEDYFGYAVPPYPEDLFNALGYMSLDMEQVEKSEMFFKFAIEFYPKSINTYDSMSEYYERIGDVDNALIFATKAYEMNQDDYYKQRVKKFTKK